LSLIEADAGVTYKYNDEIDLRGAFVYSRYHSSIRRVNPIPGLPNQTFGADYYIGKKLSFQADYAAEGYRIDWEINPSSGREVRIRIEREFNKFLRTFSFDERIGALRPIYDRYNYNSFYLDWKEYFNLKKGIDRNTLSLHLQAGLIDKPVDDFFYFFAGGMPGIKGYTYYSIQGNKMWINTLMYRAPILRHINTRLGPLYMDKLYGAVFMDYGNAWDTSSLELSDFKKSVGFQLRLDGVSYYHTYPTKIQFDAAYGLDEFVAPGGNTVGNHWKFYLQVLLGFD